MEKNLKTASQQFLKFNYLFPFFAFFATFFAPFFTPFFVAILLRLD